MNISKIFFIFLFLIQTLFLIGYYYSNSLTLFFSFTSIFDEEFVIMFAMFLVLCLIVFYSLENFTKMFTERIENLNKFFAIAFDQVLVQLNNLLLIINKLYSASQFNIMIINILNENILLILSSLEYKHNNNFKIFFKIALFKEKFISNLFHFKLK